MLDHERARSDRRPRWSWWAWWFVLLMAVIALATIVAFARGCASWQAGGLTLGCSDSLYGVDWPFFLLFWALVSGAATVLGVVVTLIARRRPTVWSFVLWASVGLLGPSVFAPDYLSPTIPEPYLWWVIAATGVLGIPAGASLGRKRTRVEGGREVTSAS